ncbi:MAG TPA: gfo/Idh/MocA family oxidoreductase, partial [Clostridiales bacterium]|nr:gfo/Idh/MocA family oxidoreductase [Clostridiales bacterium]
MTKIRVAIIGYGRSGRNIHRDLLVQLPEKYELVAFVDVDEDRRRMIREETGLEPL